MSKPGADGSIQDSLIGLWHLEQARIPISARQYSGSGWMDGMMLALDQEGGSATLSVTGKSLYGAVIENSVLFRVPEPLVNIAQFRNKSPPVRRLAHERVPVSPAGLAPAGQISLIT